MNKGNGLDCLLHYVSIDCFGVGPEFLTLRPHEKRLWLHTHRKGHRCAIDSAAQAADGGEPVTFVYLRLSIYPEIIDRHEVLEVSHCLSALAVGHEVYFSDFTPSSGDAPWKGINLLGLALNLPQVPRLVEDLVAAMLLIEVLLAVDSSGKVSAIAFYFMLSSEIYYAN